MAAAKINLLRVNLTKRSSKVESVSPEISDLMVGGRGIGAACLYKEQPANVDPLGEENRLIFLAGPLAGTQAQAMSRWMVCTKSPLTGGYARSVGGADFGAWLRFAGYDVIIIEGKASAPVYLHLTADGCQILNAGDLWGKDTVKTQEMLQQKHGDKTRIACIGPGGEKLVRYAAIMSGRRSASRCGVGAVMGSKNLKAIAINAERNVRVANPDVFKELAMEQSRLIRASHAFEHHKEWGTTMTQNVTNALGMFPVRNFRYGQMKDSARVYGEEYRKFRTGEFGCYNCPARCGKAHHITAGPYAGAWSEGPEYESIWVFTGSIDSTSIDATVRADQLCDDLGIDTISTGVSIGFAYELYERGIINRKETDGLELVYGDHQTMVKLVEKIGRREGFGNLLAEGVVRAARTIGRGAEAYVIHTKGMELPGYDPRGAKSQGFSYSTSNIGGSHCYGYAGQEVFGAPVPRTVNRFAETENADIVIFNQDGTAMAEVGIVCAFTRAWDYYPVNYSKLLAAATGNESLADMAVLGKAGARIINLERAFNVREGFSRKDDKLPPRMLKEPLHTLEAPGEGEMVREEEQFLDRYYELRGWSKDGIPTPKKLADLGLSKLVS